MVTKAATVMHPHCIPTSSPRTRAKEAAFFLDHPGVGDCLVGEADAASAVMVDAASGKLPALMIVTSGRRPGEAGFGLYMVLDDAAFTRTLSAQLAAFADEIDGGKAKQ